MNTSRKKFKYYMTSEEEMKNFLEHRKRFREAKKRSPDSLQSQAYIHIK